MIAGQATAAGVGSESHCITCADVGIPMDVVALTQCGAHCRGPDGVDQRVEIELVEPVATGDRLLVHAGVAIVNLSRATA